MTKLFLAIAATACLALGACKTNNKPENKDGAQVQNPNTYEMRPMDLPFSVAENYFLKNDVTEIANPKIERAEVFNSYFGMATTMNSKPTPIDFDVQYVVAVMQPATDVMTAIKPVSLKRISPRQIELAYKIEKGEKLSYTMTPNLIVVVDRSNDGMIVLKEEK
jgi:hypothetical protein